MKSNLNITFFGKHLEGMESEEIKEYLLARFNEMNPKNKLESCPETLYKKFNKVAGVNTMACKRIGNKLISLMYRHDIKRFSDVIFLGKTTYFD